MAWVCPSCGFDENDNAAIRCACGHEITVPPKNEVKTPPKVPRICPACGFASEGRLVNRGHWLIELIVWLVALNFCIYILPVIIAFAFTCWRRCNRHYDCFECGGRMIPIDSPHGKAIIKQQYQDQAAKSVAE
jgi:hypothetical protein